ncbi:Methyltransferase type 11 [Sarocladium implicatum]|nr:Methyltransferase type 11 [Sarocladium implicatum]
MDPPRMRFGLPARPNDGPLPRRRGGEPFPTNPSQIARPVNRSFKSDPGNSRSLAIASSLPRSSVRSPPSAARPSPQYYRTDPRPSLEHQSKSWDPSSATGNARNNTHLPQGSGSSSSERSYDSRLKPPRNVLRRKSSSSPREDVASKADSTRTSSSSSSHQRPGAHMDSPLGMSSDRRQLDSPAEIRVADTVEMRKPTIPMIYPELDRYRDHRPPGAPNPIREVDIEVPFRLATHDLPPPTPGSLLFSGSSSQVSAVSASPSTKFSESPGPGPYSRDTTPTSMSSQSPGLFIPTTRLNKTQLRYHSPALTRPPVTRRRAGSFNEHEASASEPQGLPAVRESLTSSSSNSTVRDAEKSAVMDRKSRRKLPPPPPSPPPRKSSQKFSRPSDGSSPRKQSRPSTAPESPPKGMPDPKPAGSPAPPRRPSRDGTPDMQSQLFDPVPVVHSNLSTSSLSIEKRSNDPIGPASMSGHPVTSPPTRRQALTARASMLREPSHIAGSAADSKRIAATPSEPSRAIRTPSPNVGSSSKSRFPFFGRKKSSVEPKEREKKDTKKPVRKGPAAGTGHEGYGRLGHVRRRSGARGASDSFSSQESLTEDPFLADRISPVVIAGGEVIENRNASSELTRTDSSQSLAPGRTSTESRGTNTSNSSHMARTTMWPSPGYLRPNTSSRSRRPSDSSDSEGMTMNTTLAFRRSVQRLRSSPDSPLRLPQPINTSGSATSPMTSLDTSVMSEDSHIEFQQQAARGRENPHPAPKKLTKRARSPRKWNLFSRSQSRPKKEEQDARVAATVTPVDKKPMAFYTMMESSEQEQESDVADIQQILRNADVYMSTPSLLGSSVSETSLDRVQLPVPQPPRLASSPLISSTSVDISREDVRIDLREAQFNGPEHSIVRKPSRLQQVGRIPKVVSNRHEPPSPKSFSRPFRASMQLPAAVNLPWAGEKDLSSTVTKPSPAMSAPGPSGSVTSPDMSQGTREFLAFSPRKNSDGTLGTSSSSSVSYTYAGATAVVPQASDPPAEDEVWDEYDDLLGEDRPPPSATSSRGMPFALETYESKLSRKASREKPMESPTIAIDSRKASTLSKAPTNSSVYSADMTERIRAAFQPHASPTVPFHEGLEPVTEDRRRHSIDSGTTVDELERKASARTLQLRDSTVSSSSSNDGSPLAQVNLRVGSMTVSKWLSFGHVLFSDVRHELVPVEGSLKRHSILVVDGLGNDDWSFYAAETYPAATFFNLSPRAPLPTELQSSPTGFPLSPPNHHQIQYMSHLEKFPFAPQSFTSLVYRFPVAASEATYRNILTEARRVLKPDGYLELSILDVDLNNMGNIGRRAVRGLKERIHENAPDTSVASTADLIVRLLGKLGFSSIKAARVGVPVASTVSRPSSTKEGSTSSGAKTKKDKPSLAELMSDDSPVADESITKMVSRVGRWWYTRCYENAAGPGAAAGKSIWNDKLLLSECEELGTSLKLMVCCARAPDRITSI